MNAERPGSGREKRRGGLAFWKIYTISDGWMDGWIFFFGRKQKKLWTPSSRAVHILLLGGWAYLNLGAVSDLREI